jgi:predicted nucleotidyltransferase
MEMQDTQTDDRIHRSPVFLPDIVRSIAQSPSVLAIILYGSAARMKTTPLSDTDLCVVTRPGLAPDEWETIMAHTGPDLDLVLFHDLSPSIRYRVIREGKILFNRDPVFLHRTMADTVRQYLDLKPFIDRNARRILKRAGLRL